MAVTPPGPIGNTYQEGTAMTQSSEIQRFALAPYVYDQALRLGDPNAQRLRGAGLRVGFHYGTGEPWFVARDVCEILEIDNPSQAMTRLDDDQYVQVDSTVISNEVGSNLDKGRKVLIVNESGLYALIMGSRKPVTRPFRRWVTDEVLPSIRKTGRYVEPAAPKTRVELARDLLAAEERAEALAKDLDAKTNMLSGAVAAIAENAPKVEAFEELMSADGTFSLAQAAQLVGVGRQTLIEKLAAWKVLMLRPGHSDHLRPYQAQIHLERFTCVAQTVDITHGDGTTEKLVKSTTRVTAKGVEWIRTMLRAGGPRGALAGGVARVVTFAGVPGAAR